MKKLFLLSTALVVLATSFAQADSKTKKVEDKAKTATKSTAKKVEDKTTKVEAKAKSSTVKTVTPKSKAAVTKAEKVTEIVNPPAEVAAQEVAPAPVVTQPTPPPAPLLDPNKDFEFKNDAYDFGKIPAAKPAKYDLFIKNISKETQELTLVQPGCGCTTPEYQQNQKILPGETAVVKLGFNGGGAAGAPFSKSVTVTLKGHSPKVVTFKGETYTVPVESAPANNGTEKIKPEGSK